MKIRQFRKVQRDSGVVAEFAVEFGEPPWLLLSGFRLHRRPTGLWVSMPGRKYTYNGKSIWEGHALILKPEVENELNRLAQDAYANCP